MNINEVKEKYLNNLINDEEYARAISNEINSLELKMAESIYKKLIYLCNDNRLLTAEGWFKHNLGWIYYELLDIQKAIKLQDEAIIKFEDSNNIEGKLYCYNAIFVINIKQQKFDEAISKSIKGMEIAEEYKYYEILGIMKTNVIATYTEMGEYKKAIEVHEEMKKLDYIANKSNEIAINTNRGICEYKLKNFSDAKKYMKKALKIALEIKSIFLPNVLAELSNIYIEMGLFDLAEEKLKEASTYVNIDENNVGVLAILISMADLELKKKNYEIAIEKFKDIYERINDIDFRNEIKLVCYKLNEAYIGLGLFEEAHKYLNLYVETEKEIQKSISEKKLKIWEEKRKEEKEKNYKSLYNQTDILYGFGQKITSNLEKKDIVNVIAKEIENILEYDVFQLVSYREYDGILEYQLCLEEGCRVEVPPLSIDEECYSGYCIKNKKEILIRDTLKESFKYKKTGEYTNIIVTNKKFCHSLIFIPIVINEKAIGAISVQKYEENFYNLNDLSTLKVISSFVGIALENARLYKQVQNFATYDDLTKVLNKREVLRRATEAYNLNTKNNNNVGVIMIDIDNFKNINDSYGHLAGDIVIEKVATTIKHSLREEDIVGRYGGEEFIVFLKDKELATYKAIAERIRVSIEAEKIGLRNGKQINVTVSIGVAASENQDLELETLINIADNALYRAKRTGKNKVELN